MIERKSRPRLEAVATEKEQNNELSPDELHERLLEAIDKLPEERQAWYARAAKSTIVRCIVPWLVAPPIVATTISELVHPATRYEVVETDEDGDGMPEYRHEDPETTHILNVLSGKEKLSDEDKRRFTAEAVAEMYDNLSDKQREKIGSKHSLYKKTLSQLRVDLKVTGYTGTVEEALQPYERSEYDEELYQALWSLEQENGNPRIRFYYDEQQPHFNAFTNTVEISTMNGRIGIGEAYLAELAHSQQFHNDPFYTSLGAMYGVLRAAYMTYLDNPGDLTYDTIVHAICEVEVEAHHVIEPQLNEQLAELRPRRAQALNHEIAAIQIELAPLEARDIEMEVDDLRQKYIKIIEDYEGEDYEDYAAAIQAKYDEESQVLVKDIVQKRVLKKRIRELEEQKKEV